MVQRLIVVLLVLMVVFVGCGEDEPEKVKPKVVDEAADEGPMKRIIWEADGAKMALIPAGIFEMGDHSNEGYSNERPVHRVELDAFYMDVNEVTVGQFREFVNQSGDSYNKWNDVARYSPGDDYPMIYVSWDDATAYAEWAGKRLPTEAEWEYAARGGLSGKRYPWGDEITHDDANYTGLGGKDKWDRQNAPVGSFDANGYGLNDMAGNVWEWCADRYSRGYYATSPLKNPTGPDTGLYRVLRGGSWVNNSNGLRAAYRNVDAPAYAYGLIGFRCVSGSK
ncbi:MAG TPA: formylglycine-generating enzyme family protein [Rhodospirillales bacterium]|nr:formylglycine-generating enzyme family protein [Rhodospirillales bacterium]